MPRRVLIMGAAGRDFHNFNVAYRGNSGVEVVAFTATQIPFIDDRTYPASLAGEGYPRGIPIHDESELTQLIKQRRSTMWFSATYGSYVQVDQVLLVQARISGPR